MTPSKEVTDYCKDVLNRWGWTRWDAKQAALVESRVSRGKYTCAHCGELFGPREVQVDHKQPRIDPAVGWVSLDEYAKRTFVTAPKLQILCRPCHSKKSNAENAVRRETRAANSKGTTKQKRMGKRFGSRRKKSA